METIKRHEMHELYKASVEGAFFFFFFYSSPEGALLSACNILSGHKTCFAMKH